MDAAQFGRAQLRARVVTAWLAGGSPRQVAAECGVSPGTVQAIIAATPGVVEERAARTAAAEEELRKAAVAWSKRHPGVPLAEGAATLGVPVARLRSLVGDRVCWHPPTRPVRRRYTDEELLRHVSDWVGAYGSSAAGYRAAAQTRPGWPSLTTITGRFGSWSHALQAAGLIPAPGRPGRSRVWSEAALAQLVADYLGQAQSPSLGGFGAWLAAEATRPSLTLVRRRLGTWPQLLAYGAAAARPAGPAPDNR